MLESGQDMEVYGLHATGYVLPLLQSPWKLAMDVGVVGPMNMCVTVQGSRQLRFK